MKQTFLAILLVLLSGTAARGQMLDSSQLIDQPGDETVLMPENPPMDFSGMTEEEIAEAQAQAQGMQPAMDPAMDSQTMLEEVPEGQQPVDGQTMLEGVPEGQPPMDGQPVDGQTLPDGQPLPDGMPPQDGQPQGSLVPPRQEAERVIGIFDETPQNNDWRSILQQVQEEAQQDILEPDVLVDPSQEEQLQDNSAQPQMGGEPLLEDNSMEEAEGAEGDPDIFVGDNPTDIEGNSGKDSSQAEDDTWTPPKSETSRIQSKSSIGKRSGIQGTSGFKKKKVEQTTEESVEE